MATASTTDIYVNALIESGKIDEAAYVNGASTITAIESEEIVVSDGSANIDIYRFFKGLNPNLVIIDLKVYVDDAVVGATDCDLGLYEQTNDRGDGVVSIVDVFADGIDLVALGASGVALRGGTDTTADGAIDGLVNVGIDVLTRKLYQHAGHAVGTYKQGYDLALTIRTDVTTGGTVTIIAQFIEN